MLQYDSSLPIELLFKWTHLGWHPKWYFRSVSGPHLMADHWTIINWTVKIRKRSARLVSRMIGEFLRDGGILVIVFGILDRLSSKNGNAELSIRWVVGCLAVGTGGFVLGTLFGVWGQQPEDEEIE